MFIFLPFILWLVWNDVQIKIESTRAMTQFDGGDKILNAKEQRREKSRRQRRQFCNFNLKFFTLPPTLVSVASLCIASYNLIEDCRLFWWRRNILIWKFLSRSFWKIKMLCWCLSWLNFRVIFISTAIWKYSSLPLLLWNFAPLS